ncbi:MAG: glycosyltransferase [Oscillochloris sp.]|nr:glycosyltransferase [Oscillochloris sp.]
MKRTPLASVPAWNAYAAVGNLPAPIINEPALPLVSIVTPSFNQGRFIAATVRSVLQQDYPNIEYWLIDGGSSDETFDVLAQFAGDARLHVIREPDRGQADAINKGWARCHGDVLAWLNSDDELLPAAIRTQVAALNANPAAAAVYADALYTDPAGKPIRPLYGRPYHPLTLLRLEIPAQPTVFLRREAVAMLGPLDITRRYSMDSDYWARLARHAPMAQTQALVATYRLHGMSKTVRSPAGFYDEWLAIAQRFFAAPGLPDALRDARAAVLADIYAAMANLEAQAGRFGNTLRYLAYGLSLAGLRPRMLKLPLTLLDRLLPLGLAGRAGTLWGSIRRRRKTAWDS